MPKKKVTFNDIAKFTGFSKTTISRYFNNPDSLTAKNQAIISEALEKLDYQENKLAKVLANGKSEFVGIVIPDLYTGFYADVLNVILTSYENYGYKFLVFVGNPDIETERSCIRELLAYEIEGLIDLSRTIPSRELASYGIPVVTIEREDTFVSSVNTDNYMGGTQAASLLIKSGCEVLFHLNYDIDETNPACGRIKGFADTCRDAGMEYHLILKDLGQDFASTRTIFEQLLDEITEKYAGRKKGIFLSNDNHANILLNLLVRRYGKLPDDICIVGFDNSPVSREAIIPISTIGQQVDVIAREAMAILVDQMQERKKRRPQEKPLVHKVITPVLVRRETTI